MNSEFDPERSDAIRSLLVTTAVAPRRVGGVLASIGLVALGLVIGASVSAAAITLNAPDAAIRSAGSGVPAPSGVTPGQPIVSLLGSPVTETVHGDADITLGALPTGATHARVTFICLTAGTTSWGFDASGNNPSSACNEQDLADPANSGYFDFPLDESTTTLFIRAAPTAEAVVSYQFLNYVETAWGVNAKGETFGASKDGVGDPELVAVSIETASGEDVLAYSRSTDLNAFGPDWPNQPSNPTEAIAWQKERDAKYPNGWDIPAYESDGVTQVGVFHIGG